MTNQPAVTAAGATLRYGEITALDGVSVVVPVGQKVALVGPSGAGKSSLLEAIVGRVRLSAGNLTLFGQDPIAMRGRKLRRLRARIGVVNQGLDLAPALRVVHNVNAGRLGQWSAMRSVASLVRPAGVDEVASVLRLVGLDDRLQARTDDLSGGEKQRVAIARVLLQAPELVLADEPTASVDPKLADDMMGLLCERSQTLVVSAHDPLLARRHVDRIVGLRRGSIVFDVPAGDVDETMLTDFYSQ